MTEIVVNSNFHTSTKKTVFDDRKDEKFTTYRRIWYENPKKFIVGNFPIHLDIESASACNLKCPFCASTMKNWGPDNKGFMEFALFKKIIDESTQNGLFSIKLSLRGEPLLHPRLCDMIRYAKEKGIIDIYFNTNAVLLDEKMIHSLIEAGLDRISISFEGYTKEIYEKYRVGANFESVRDNIILLKKIRDELNIDYPKIRIQMVLLPELAKIYPSYVAYWEKIADEVGFLDERSEGSLTEDQKLQANWACSFLWQRGVILWDGTVLPCLMHGVKDFSQMKLGNVRDMSVRDMWLGEKNVKNRLLHKEGRSHEIDACVKCSYRTSEIKKLMNTHTI